MAESGATIVLVHGAWADGSSWSRVIPLLQAKGRRVIAAQLPLSSLADDLAATNRIVSDIDGPIVLVGHSWGGMAVTQASPPMSLLWSTSPLSPPTSAKAVAV